MALHFNLCDLNKLIVIARNILFKLWPNGRLKTSESIKVAVVGIQFCVDYQITFICHLIDVQAELLLLLNLIVDILRVISKVPIPLVDALVVVLPKLFNSLR